MTISRVKTWTSEVLTATDLNAEFNNILNFVNASPIIAVDSLTLATNDFLQYSGSAWSNKTPAQVFAALTGTTTNDSAAAGHIGEFTSSTVLSGAAVSIVTGTAKDITSISLAAGDWDVQGYVEFQPALTTVLTVFQGWTSAASATNPTRPNNGGLFLIQNSGFPNGVNQGFSVGGQRFSLASTTTVYLSINASFTTSTAAAFGFISARRVR